MPRDYADAAAHQAIPEEFLECLLTRRHAFPMGQAKRQRVRIQYGPGRDQSLDMIEYTGTCERCGCERVMLRDRHANKFVHATYNRPDGYEPPSGLLWDRDALWAEYERRHPVKGRVRVIER